MAGWYVSSVTTLCPAVRVPHKRRLLANATYASVPCCSGWFRRSSTKPKPRSLISPSVVRQRCKIWQPRAYCSA